jgi:hypothetical protein
MIDVPTCGSEQKSNTKFKAKETDTKCRRKAKVYSVLVIPETCLGPS